MIILPSSSDYLTLKLKFKMEEITIRSLYLFGTIQLSLFFSLPSLQLFQMIFNHSSAMENSSLELLYRLQAKLSHIRWLAMLPCQCAINKTFMTFRRSNVFSCNTSYEAFMIILLFMISSPEGRSGKLSDTEQKAFQTQAECLGYSGPAPYTYNGVTGQQHTRLPFLTWDLSASSKEYATTVLLLLLLLF